jgi:WD40 repeat protein
VVRAGLIPALRRGGLPSSENWFIVDMLPGKHPFEELEASLLRVAVNPPASLLSQLKDGTRGLLRAVHRILPADESVELVLVIDQFEEVFTLVEEETERALLLESLATAVLDEHSRLRVVMTLRADFTDKPLHYTDFGEIMNRRFEFVLPLTADEVERAVAGPAQRVGLKLEKGLISTIIREAGNQPGALPLLQYALSELFEKREGRTLTNQVYREIGGVLGALGRSAESIYANLDEIGQSTTRQLFLRLVTLGEGAEDTRRRVLRTELENLTIEHSHNRLSEIINLFGNARLLTFDHDPITRGATIEIAHEALLREWERLGEWLYESRADVRFQRQLATAASEWGQAREDSSFLLMGVRLEQFEGWAAKTTVALTRDERDFLDVSIAERNRRETEERDRQQREFEAAQKLAETERQSVINLRGRNRIISTVGVIALLLAILASVFGFNSNQNAQQAVNAKATAQTESLIRATAENNAIQSAAQAFSRELAVQSEFNLNVDTQRSILLALAGLDKAYTHEAENALHKAVQAERELMSIKNATSGVYSLAFSPDGKRLVSSSGASKVWDAATGKELFSFGNNLLIYSPDGTLLAGLEPVGQLVKISILDAQTGQKLLSLKDVPFADGRNMNFSPDGQLMLDVTGKIEFFDSKTGQLNSTLSGPDWTYKGLKEGDADLPFTVNAAVFSADGKRLAIDLLSDGNRNFGRVEVWDYPSRQRLLSVPVNFDVDRAFAFSPDGKYIVTAGKNGGPSVVLDAITGKELYRLSNAAYFNGFTFTPDGKYILSASEDGSVQMWEASTGGLILTLNGHQGAVFQASVSPGCVSPPTAPFEWCGLRLATSGADATIKIWDISPSGSGELLTLPGSNFFVDSDWSRLTTIVKIQPDQGGFQGIVQSWDLPVLTSPFTAKPQVSNYFSSTVDANKAALGLRIIQSAKLLIATFFDQDEFFRIWDVSSGEAKEMTTACCASVTEKADGKWILGEDVSPDRRFLFVGLNQGNIDVFDLHTGKKIHTFAVSEEGALCCETLSPDGTTLAVAATDLQIWDVATAHLSKTWPLIDTYISIMAFSPDGKSLLVGTCSGTVKVLDVATGENKFTLLSGSPSCVNSFGFSHDGRRVAIGSESGPLEIWDWNTHEEVLQLPFGNAPTNLRMQFSPDDTRLMVSAFDADAVVQNTVRVYVLPTKDIIALAKSRLTRTLTTEECQKYLHVDVCPSSP